MDYEMHRLSKKRWFCKHWKIQVPSGVTKHGCEVPEMEVSMGTSTNSIEMFHWTMITQGYHIKSHGRLSSTPGPTQPHPPCPILDVGDQLVVGAMSQLAICQSHGHLARSWGEGGAPKDISANNRFSCCWWKKRFDPWDIDVVDDQKWSNGFFSPTTSLWFNQVYMWLTPWQPKMAMEMLRQSWWIDVPILVTGEATWELLEDLSFRRWPPELVVLFLNRLGTFQLDTFLTSNQDFFKSQGSRWFKMQGLVSKDTGTLNSAMGLSKNMTIPQSSFSIPSENRIISRGSQGIPRP